MVPILVVAVVVIVVVGLKDKSVNLVTYGHVIFVSAFLVVFYDFCGWPTLMPPTPL